MFDITKYKKNYKKIKSLLKSKDSSIVATDRLFMVVPTRYQNIGLMDMSSTVHTLGIALILDGLGNGAVMKRSNIIETSPSSLFYKEVNGKQYLVMEFKKGDNVIVNDNVVVSADVTGVMFDDWYIKNGNTPYYLEYEDVPQIFIDAVENGDKLGARPVDMMMITSIISKGSGGKYFRQTNDDKPKFVGMSNVSEGINNAMSLMTGNYLHQGITKLLDGKNLTKSDLEIIL